MVVFFLRCLFVFLVLVLLSFLALAKGNSDFDNTFPVGENLDVIAFVGKKVSFKENTIYPTVKETLIDGTVVERKIAAFNSRYEAKYKVLRWVTEDTGQDIIEFEVYDHYSDPQLPYLKTPLVLLVNYEGKWVQSKYNNYDLSRTTDGDWAICGPPEQYERMKDKGERYVETLAFLNPIRDLEGNICKAGTRVNDIIKYQNETRFLPEKWRVSCNLKLGVDKNTIAGTGSAPEAEQIGVAHKACVERLKFEAITLPD